LPDEDQGYLIVSAQLPVGASKERTDAVMQQVSQIAKAIPGVDHVVAISGISLLDNLAPLSPTRGAPLSFSMAGRPSTCGVTHRAS
jgi:multidrug efflux pump subunit AcrB